MRRLAAILFRSFLQGLLLLSPIAITAYVLYAVFDRIDSLVPYVPRGLGFFIIVFFVTFVGYLGTRLFLGRWLFDAFGHVLERTPGVKFIYSSVRDMIGSFVGDKKRFNRPVWVCTNINPEMWRIGFLTQRDMSHLGMVNKVAVYLPHSYAISGWVIIVESKYVKPVTKMTAGEAMKFAVSGGVTNIEEDSHDIKTKIEL
ncbi:MAG: DUF502 domain-containing protein [Bacteroidetes bacterium]|nr:DUF502 domain-containing protein [Bacteroidota bacterium]